MHDLFYIVIAIGSFVLLIRWINGGSNETHVQRDRREGSASPPQYGVNDFGEVEEIDKPSDKPIRH